MKGHVLAGSKQEIAVRPIRISGEVHKVIMFEDETAATVPEVSAADPADIFAEMRPFMVEVRDVLDSSEAIHSRMEGE